MSYFDVLLGDVKPYPVEGFGHSLMTVKVQGQLTATRDCTATTAAATTTVAAGATSLSTKIHKALAGYNPRREDLRRGIRNALRVRTATKVALKKPTRFSRMRYSSRKVWRKNILYRRNF